MAKHQITMKLRKPELLLPVGSFDCLRAAANNGADAVYLGLDRFNARRNAKNFNERNLYSVVEYCHKRRVRVYVTLNILVKNSEIADYLRYAGIANSAGADAVIIQDPCMIPLLRKNFPRLKIHLSTQAFSTNMSSVPSGIDRVVLPREMALDDIRMISKRVDTEIFVHGALCFSMSGQCLFSSLVGGRSANRGLCAQPCRMVYNNKYLLSTMDLCLVDMLPQVIGTGAGSLKIEGRMRSPLYVATAARIYRKYIDLFFKNPSEFSVDKRDMDRLKLAFSREFTHGFGFTDSVVDSRAGTNRGLFLGRMKDGKIMLKAGLKVGDGVSFWRKEGTQGLVIDKIVLDGKRVRSADEGSVVGLGVECEDMTPVYKTSSPDMKANLGEEVQLLPERKPRKEAGLVLPEFKKAVNNDAVRIFAKAYCAREAIELEGFADVIYYDALKDDVSDVRKRISKSRFFLFTPKYVREEEIPGLVSLIRDIGADGVLAANRGILKHLDFLKDDQIHLDYPLNVFNDADISCYRGIPIVSPELSLSEVSSLASRRFAVLVHGDIVLMTTKEVLRAPELVDCEGRHFRVRQMHGCTEILNTNQVGLFNKAQDYASLGVKYFYIDTEKEAAKFARIYRKILSGEKFDDSRIRKGYTTGHMGRGVE